MPKSVDFDGISVSTPHTPHPSRPPPTAALALLDSPGLRDNPGPPPCGTPAVHTAASSTEVQGASIKKICIYLYKRKSSVLLFMSCKSLH